MLVLIVLDFIYLIVSPKVRYERYRYCITKDKIDVKEGFIFTERNIVPIERLHKIAIEKGPIYSIFGLSKVVVTTAGGDIDISFLEDDKADFIAESLKDKINEISINQKNKKLEELVKLISEKGYELDYNVAGLFKEDCGEVYISGYLAELVKKYNVKVVLGSDSHSSKFIDKYKVNI